MKASIVIPIFNPNETYDSLVEFLEAFKGEYEIIIIEGKDGLANAYNQGIKKATCDIVITLHQDCIPQHNAFDKLIEAFNDKNVVMAFTRVLDFETRVNYCPCPPDGKLVAYRKSTLAKVGYFDEDTFLTGGEDVDMYIKMLQEGILHEVDSSVQHFHEGYLGNKTDEKRKQNGNINGALFRVHGFDNPKAFRSLILCLRHPTTYGSQFIKGYREGKQTYRRELENSDCYKSLRGDE